MFYLIKNGFYLGYHGDALASTKEEGCNPCHCNLYGTLELIEGGIVPCDKLTGYCSCKPHVTGKNCDRCEDGYYDIRSGEVDSFSGQIYILILGQF